MGTDKNNDAPAAESVDSSNESNFGNPAMLYQQGLDQGYLRG